jgi:multidrug efflux system membrane fusion protein
VSAEGGGKGGGRGGGGDVPVTITTVRQQDVPVDIQVVGNVEAYSSITIRALAGGELVKVLVREGDYVKTGDMLFVIDRRPTEAMVLQTQANLAKQIAVLKQLQAQMARDEAQAHYSQSQADRYQKLYEQGIMSKDQTEQTTATAGVSTQTVAADAAAIDSARADIAATQAALDNVKIQLGYTEIRSPINGRTGALLVKQGTLVAANTTDLISINQVQPIFVTFSVPEGNLPEIKKYMAERTLKVYAKPQEAEGEPELGKLSFVDNTVDMTTGTIKLKGQFENSALKLWPGQFVRVTLRLTTRPNALVLPNQAIQTGQEGTYVYVVKQDQKVEARKVETGPRIDQNLVIESGLSLGDTVVLDGQLRLAPGSKVSIRDPNRAGRAAKKPAN